MERQTEIHLSIDYSSRQRLRHVDLSQVGTQVSTHVDIALWKGERLTSSSDYAETTVEFATDDDRPFVEKYIKVCALKNCTSWYIRTRTPNCFYRLRNFA